MRYEDWDILLFPTGRESKVPMKEFKVACHVVPDGEFSHSHGAYGLPVMTCFIPGLPAGTPFHISIHSWRTPEVSQFTRTYSKHADLVKFEARILVDGRAVASTSFDRLGQWPHLINSTFEFTKAGELEPLKFPQFRRELLYQNHWNPGDEVGRVKIVISEGFPRDSLTTPIERVKNIVAFSFQHAPMDILESNGIAWPNPHMWRGPSLNPSLPVPTYHPEDGSDSHGHSPRRRSSRVHGSSSQGLHIPLMPTVIPAQTSTVINPAFVQSAPLLQRGGTSSGSSCPDPFTEPAAYKEWLNSLGLSQFHLPQSDILPHWPNAARMAAKQSSTDTSMPDYLSSGSVNNFIQDQFQISTVGLDDDFGAQALQAPTNTPTAATGDDAMPPSCFDASASVIPSELATSLTHSLLNQPHPLPILPHQIPLPASEVKSRKENRQLYSAGVNMSPMSPAIAAETVETRKFSQPYGIMGGSLSASSTRVSSTSPSSRPAFSANISRTNSGIDFGANITNLADPPPPPSDYMTDKGVKRARNFTPASAKAIDDEDEPRRSSPRLRVGPCPGDGADEE